ncbi:TonB-dependent receptor domain-containing protein [Pacificimonas sp. ICDLI1SI03]
MFSRHLVARASLSASAAGIAIIAGTAAIAQSTAIIAQPDDTPAEEAGVVDQETIVVTGSRINRAGFDQPTPTTVIGDAEIRQAARQNLQQVLNDQPQFRNTISPSGTIADLRSGTAPADLRGLGADRTLTLLNGRRFVGDNNLNYVPTNLVERLEVVTGGASAAWGSDAVAGVVNIILNEDLDGFSVGGQTGISSRGDGMRYGVDASFGTDFADGRGHFMIGAEYLDDKGIGITGRGDRPWLGANLVPIEGGQVELQPDVNGLGLTFPGNILSGSLAGQVFNPDGSLRPFQASDDFGFYDTLIVGSPLKRLASYARLSYDVGGATIWLDGTYGRADVNQPFLPDTAQSILVSPISATNPFLSANIRQQLAAAGEPSFLLGRVSRDAFLLQYDHLRENKEVAVGVNGEFGAGWQYDAHFSHGEVDSDAKFYNSSIPANFSRALDAVRSGGEIVCAVNADADPTNDDPACVPFNPFGENAASAAAVDYVSGTQMQHTVNKLDSAAVRLQGEPFSLWAGPVSIAVGAESRWEEQQQDVGELDAAGVFGTAIYANPVEGNIDVQEGFGELLLPLLDVEQMNVEFNGAARYSDYSQSGGIWSWKLGGTARLFNDILLRVTRSRDIRAPGLSELFSSSQIGIITVNDSDSAGRNDPDYNPNPRITRLSSGNPNLVPEVGKTWTAGITLSPSFLSGFNLSVDYYDIKIGNAITTPEATDVTAACAAGDSAACDLIVRDDTGTITTFFAPSQNIAQFQTSGVDVEASYNMPLSRISNLPGTLGVRALATYVDELAFNNRDVAGDVGDTVLDGVPKWRGNLSLTYQSDTIGLDARIRYVGGGDFDSSQPIVNNDIDARTYVDLGAQFKVDERFTVFGNVNNLFDVDPPLVIQTTNTHYNGVGTYYTFGARISL